MKRKITPFLLFAFPAILICQIDKPLLLTGVFDGPLTGGIPKGIELYVIEDIPDLSLYGVGSANNGGGTDGVEYTFPAVGVSRGDFLYLATDSASFYTFFGFYPDFVHSGSNSSVNINGDDAIELFEDSLVIDIFGDINADGSGLVWDYLDGWAYRENGTGPDSSVFIASNWKYSGIDVFDNQVTNATSPIPFPHGTYTRLKPAFIVAKPDHYQLGFNKTLEVNVLDNDLIPNDTFTSVNLISLPLHGTADLETLTGVLQYQPLTDFCGLDSLWYSVCMDAFCDTTTVTIQVGCPPPLYPISLIKTNNSTGVPDSLGVLCELRGIVHGVNLRPGGLQFTLIEGDAGVGVFNTNQAFGYSVTEGDSVSVTGRIGQFAGLTQINIDTLVFYSGGNQTMDPRMINLPIQEQNESQIISIRNAYIVNPAEWNNSAAGFSVRFSSGTDTFVVRIDNDVELVKSPVPVGGYIITGIGSQFDQSSPFDDGYQIMPRYAADMMPDPLSTDDKLDSEGVLIFPNPGDDFVQIRCPENLQVIRFFDNWGRLKFEIQKPVNLLKVNTTEWERGIYIAVMSGKSAEVCQKFIINR